MDMAVNGAIGRERRIRPMGTGKWTMASMGALLGAVPWTIQSMVIVTFTLTLLDTITGIWLAAIDGSIRSHKMRTGIASKSLQFLTIGILGACATFITGLWHPLGAAVGLIVAIEAASNLENVLRLEKCGGVRLGKFRPALLKLGEFFAVGQESAVITEQADRKAEETK